MLTRPLVRIPASRWLPAFEYNPIQIAAHIACWIPVVLLINDYVSGDTNFLINPIQHLTFYTGDTAIRCLVLSLACTPASTLFGFKEAVKVRRPLGLYAFLYALAHFGIFLFDYSFDPGLLYEAIFEKRYALAGFAAFLILLPLALTSTQGWQKRLGKWWKQLHRLVYVAGILVVIHYVWLVKSDIRTPLVYGAIVILLLIARIPAVRRWATGARMQIAGRLRTVWLRD